MSYKFKSHLDIGSLDAENDDFLMKSFVEISYLPLLLEKNQKSILLGRTGIGKSALIRYLEEKQEHISRINPEAMSLRHLSNSTIIKYFNSLDVKLDLFYKVLWKHVFIVEIIKLKFNNDLEKSNHILEWFKNKFSDRKKKKAIDYLERWENHFWENTEHRIKEIEINLEKKYKQELGISGDLEDFIKLNSNISKEEIDKKKIKSEFFHKAQKVVNEVQIEEIEEIMNLLQNDIFKGDSKKYFIVIDDLDKDWVDNSLVYDLIKSLIETIKDFSRVPNVKIVVALRTNIFKKIFSRNSNRGFQREKYNQILIDLEWKKENLEELLSKRLKILMKDSYTNTSPKIDEVLPAKTANSERGFDYMLKRTSMRPRDIIDFFNKCIKHADGQTKISMPIIRSAEMEYSNERLRALHDEWLENYGDIEIIHGFLKNTNPTFKISDISEKASDYFLSVVAQNKDSNLSDGIKETFLEYKNNLDPIPINLIKKCLIILYEIGMIGIKLSSESKTEYIESSSSPCESNDINENETRFYIHPMYHEALKIKKKSTLRSR